MPKYRIETSDGAFEIEADREPTEADVSELMAGGKLVSSAALTPSGKLSDESEEPVADEPVAEAEPVEDMQADWAGATPMKRLGMLVKKFPSYLADEILGKARNVEGMAERSIPPTVGQFAGRATRIPGADRVLGAIGGAIGEGVAQYREGGDIRPGAIGSAALQGLVRGKGLNNAKATEVLIEGGKYAGVNLAGEVLEAGVDGSDLGVKEAAIAAGTGFAGAGLSKVFSKPGATVGGRDALYDMEMETLRSLRKEGVVIPPSEIEKGSDTIASFAGKAATQQEAAKRNQFVWQKLAREEVGLSKESLPIRVSELEAVRKAAGEPYRQIQTIHNEAKQQLADRMAVIAKESDPHLAMMALEEPAMKESLSILNILAEADVDALKAARFSANQARKKFFEGDPKSYELWQSSKAEANRLEDAIERAAASLRDDKLLGQLKAARQKIAKSYSVEDALNLGNGFVDPVAFGRQLANGEPLTGNLEKIGKFQMAFRREAVEAGRVPAPGVGNIGAMATTGMASRGDVPGVIGGVLNMTLGRAARPFLLSDMVQDGMMNPKEMQNFAAVLARYVAENSPESRRANAQSDSASQESDQE